MTTVTLTEVWINLASDPDNQYVYFGANATTDVYAIDGQRRKRADGSTVSVRQPGTTRDIGVNASYVARADVATLITFVGQRVLFRDTFGRNAYGVFYNLNTSEELGYDDVYGSVSFSIAISGTQPGA